MKLASLEVNISFENGSKQRYHVLLNTYPRKMHGGGLWSSLCAWYGRKKGKHMLLKIRKLVYFGFLFMSTSTGDLFPRIWECFWLYKNTTVMTANSQKFWGRDTWWSRGSAMSIKCRRHLSTEPICWLLYGQGSQRIISDSCSSGFNLMNSAALSVWNSINLVLFVFLLRIWISQMSHVLLNLWLIGRPNCTL